jgi:hypothetical protein
MGLTRIEASAAKPLRPDGRSPNDEAPVSVMKLFHPTFTRPIALFKVCRTQKHSPT